MRIQIDLQGRDPPVGTVLRPDGSRVGFDGWLGLLRVLSEELDGPEPTRQGPTQGPA